MQPAHARTLADQLLREHGLLDLGWSFAWSNGLNQLGHCCWRSRTIRLSRHFVALNGPELVRATVLHEIAHALAGPGTGHGPAWQRIARSLGVPPRASTAEAVMPRGRWDMVCGLCGQVLTREPRHRRSSLRRRYHVRCGPDSAGRLFWRERVPDAPDRDRQRP